MWYVKKVADLREKEASEQRDDEEEAEALLDAI